MPVGSGIDAATTGSALGLKPNWFSDWFGVSRPRLRRNGVKLGIGAGRERGGSNKRNPNESCCADARVMALRSTMSVVVALEKQSG